MKKWKRWLCIITTMLILLVVVSIFSNNFNKSVVFDLSKLQPPKKLNELRNLLLEDFKEYNQNKKCKVFHNTSKIINDLGTCYFSVVVQAICANKYIVEGLIFTDYDNNRPFSLLWQIIAYKTLTSKAVNFNDIMDWLNNLCTDYSLFKKQGGNALKTYVFTIDRIFKEKQSNEKLLNKISHQYAIERINDCKNCKKRDVQVLTNNHIQFNYYYFNTQHNNLVLNTNTNKSFHKQCIKPNVVSHLTVSLPNTLIVYIQPEFIDKEQSYRLKQSICEKITIYKQNYFLSGINCVYMTKAGLHAILYVKKGDKWFHCSDHNVYQVNIEQETYATHYYEFFLYVKE